MHITDEQVLQLSKQLGAVPEPVFTPAELQAFKDDLLGLGYSDELGLGDDDDDGLGGVLVGAA